MQASREINFPATFLALLLSPNHLSSMQTDPLASSVAHTLDVIPAYIRCRLETQLSGNWLYSGLPFTEEKSMERTAVIFARLSNCCYFWCWALSERIPKGQAKMAQPAMQVKPRLFPQWKDKAAFHLQYHVCRTEHPAQACLVHGSPFCLDFRIVSDHI